MSNKDRIRGISIAVGGDTTEFTDALQATEKNIKTLSDELRQVDKALKLDPGNMELVSQKSDVLGETIAGVSAKLTQMREHQAQVNTGFDAMGNAIPKDAIRTYNREVAGAEATLQRLQGQLSATNQVMAGDFARGFSDSLAESKRSVAGLTDELGQINAALKLDPTNVDLVQQRTAVLAQTTTELSGKLDLLKTEQTRVRDGFETMEQAMGDKHFRELGREIESTTRALSAVKQETGQSSAAMGQLGTQVMQMGSQIGVIPGGLSQATRAFQTFGKGAATSLAAATMGLSVLVALIAEGVSAAHAMQNEMALGIQSLIDYEENAARLAHVMRNTMDATQDMTQRVLDLADAQERVGVVSATVQIAGAQELATYLEREESLKRLIPVMNDMIAQQNGFNATQQSAVGVATMLGKVMDGQVGALSRLGYRFDETQADILRTGEESERLAVLIDVVSQSVGGMNEALGETDEGKIVRLTHAMEAARAEAAQLHRELETEAALAKARRDKIWNEMWTEFTNANEDIQRQWNQLRIDFDDLVQRQVAGILRIIGAAQYALARFRNDAEAAQRHAETVARNQLRSMGIAVETTQTATAGMSQNFRIESTEWIYAIHEMRVAAEEAAKAAERAGSAAGRAGSGMAAAAREAQRLAEKAKREEEQRVRTLQSETARHANLVRDALINSYQQAFDDRAYAIGRQLDAVRNAAFEERTIAGETRDTRVQMLTDEYIERIRLINEAKGAALSAINAEIEAELERIGIVSAESAAEIEALQTRRAEIAAAREAERQAEAQARYEREKNTLLEQISRAETMEELQRLQERLDDLSARRRRELLEEERRAEERGIDAAIRDRQRLWAEDVAAAEKAIKAKNEMQRNALAGDEDSLEAQLEAEKEREREMLAAQKNMATRVAAGLVTAGEAGQLAALELLEAYLPEWRDSGKQMADFLREGFEAGSEGLADETEVLGEETMQGFLDGLLSKENDIVAAAERIAAAVRQTIEGALMIASPSRVMMQDGAFVGEGLALGIRNSIQAVKAASADMAQAARFGMGQPGVDGFGTAAAARHQAAPPAQTLPQLVVNIQEFHNARADDIQELGERLAFEYAARMRGRY